MHRTTKTFVAALLATGAAAPSTAAAAPVARALYHMDEAPGATRMIDSSGYGNSAALTSFGIKLGVAGFSGTAYSFTGAGGRASVSSSTLNPGSANLSMVAHFSSTTKPSSAVGDYDLIRKAAVGSAAPYYKMEVLQSGVALCLFASPTTQTVSSSGVSVVNGAWHTIRCSKTATAISVTVDARTWTKQVSIGSIANTAPLTVGAKPDGTDTVTGKLDEVAIYVG
jgi:hypothetical protein